MNMNVDQEGTNTKGWYKNYFVKPLEKFFNVKTSEEFRLEIPEVWKKF